jgi:hypothetical protein
MTKSRSKRRVVAATGCLAPEDGQAGVPVDTGIVSPPFPDLSLPRRSEYPVKVTGEARSHHRDRGSGIAVDARDGAIETSISEEIDTTRVSVTKHFGHSKVCESKPGLSGSMIRNDIVSPHFAQRGLLILSMNITPPPY